MWPVFQEINDRMEYLINKIVRQITAHAESLHEEVEVMAKVRNKPIKNQYYQYKYRLTLQVYDSSRPLPYVGMHQVNFRIFLLKSCKLLEIYGMHVHVR